MITLHSCITALAKSLELRMKGEQKLTPEAWPNETFNLDFNVYSH